MAFKQLFLKLVTLTYNTINLPTCNLPAISDIFGRVYYFLVSKNGERVKRQFSTP